ncbi:hypothetical protein [Psychrobacter alimentarius]|uniref:hypothetical protein n=1 Tax=Psychrobacter alimentarius TaxID=261164 RepID=UPI003FD41C00
MVKLLVGALLALTAANTMAGNITYKADDGSMRTTHIADTIEEFYGNDKRAMINAQLLRTQADYATTYLQNYQTNRRMKPLVPEKSETVFRNGSNVDTGAKMGMTPNQVLTKTYWGKPKYTNVTTDEMGKLEQWIYGDYVNFLIFDNDKLISIQQVISYRE